MLTRALFILVLSSGPAAALELALPLACTPGTDCFIQQYVDRDPGPGAQDYACGGETYDGHKGTDIRLRTTADIEKGVAVKASADGVVIGARDGMEDHLVRSDADRAAIKDRECGNGVLLDHGQGWHNQYCHMRKGSVAVKKGDQVATGAKLGEVGYSGDAAFAHVHLQVTKDDKVVDPFLADDAAVCGKEGPSLWSASAKAALPYQQGTLLALGFADHAVTLQELETGAALAAPNDATPVLVYLWAINLKNGDVIEIALSKEGAVVANNRDTLDHDKAQYMLFVGKKAPPGGWPGGTYTGAVKVTRAGSPVINQTQTLTLN